MTVSLSTTPAAPVDCAVSEPPAPPTTERVVAGAAATPEADELLARMAVVRQQVLEGLEIMNRSDQRVNITLSNETLSPRIKKDADGLTIEIPLIYILKPEDFRPSSLYYRQIRRLGPNVMKYEGLINRFYDNPVLASQAKRFAIFHELAHDACGHLETRAKSPEERRGRERQADIVAAIMSKAVEGGAYLFRFLAALNSSPSPPDLSEDTHPEPLERAAYLEEFATRQREGAPCSYVWPVG